MNEELDKHQDKTNDIVEQMTKIYKRMQEDLDKTITQHEAKKNA